MTLSSEKPLRQDLNKLQSEVAERENTLAQSEPSVQEDISLSSEIPECPHTKEKNASCSILG